MTVLTIVSDEASGSNRMCKTTPTFEAITNLLSGCQETRLLGVVVGAPGTGKSTATEAYAAGRRGAVYCRMERVAEKSRAGMLLILEAVERCKPYLVSEFDASQRIKRAMRDMADPVLILDEAQHMSDGLLESARDIYDGCEMGLVLVGNPTLQERWSGKGGRRRQTFDQLRGRMGPQLTLKRPTEKDIGGILRHHGIEDDSTREKLATLAREPGGLHNTDPVLSIARRIQGDDKPLTTGSVHAALAIAKSGGFAR